MELGIKLKVMPKIGILSDTHLRYPTDQFKRFVDKTFGNTDMLIHAGDIVSLEVYDFLSKFNLKAVCGNMDDLELRSVLPEKLTFQFAGIRFGLIHGRGSPFGIEEIVLREFENVDVIIFGHSHVPMSKKKGKIHLFNPGSFRKPYTPPGTVGVCKIEEGGFAFDHLPVTEA
jgi:putative phosphoesterase